ALQQYVQPLPALAPVSLEIPIPRQRARQSPSVVGDPASLDRPFQRGPLIVDYRCQLAGSLAACRVRLFRGVKSRRPSLGQRNHCREMAIAGRLLRAGGTQLLVSILPRDRMHGVELLARVQGATPCVVGATRSLLLARGAHFIQGNERFRG